MHPPDFLYTKEHDWIEVYGDEVTIGITDYAQSELGDIVFVELPEIGKEIDHGDELYTIESVKAVSEVTSSLSGVVIEVNDFLEDQPELINEDPYKDGWVVKLRISEELDKRRYLNSEEYEEFLS